MKTMWFVRSAAGLGSGASLVRKSLLASLVLLLVLTSLPVSGASAASSSLAKELEKEWSDKLLNLKAESLFYQRVRVYPADFKDPAELARAHELLNSYGIAYRAAQTAVFKNAGFNADGRVIHEVQANQSIKAVAEQLHTMRGLRKKLDELEGQYRLLPLSVVTATASR